MQAALVTDNTPDHDGRALKILAKSIYKELRQNGYSRSEIVAFSTELLGHVTSEIKCSGEPVDPSYPA